MWDIYFIVLGAVFCRASDDHQARGIFAIASQETTV
jgi:hypothetical protein